MPFILFPIITFVALQATFGADYEKKYNNGEYHQVIMHPDEHNVIVPSWIK